MNTGLKKSLQQESHGSVLIIHVCDIQIQSMVKLTITLPVATSPQWLEHTTGFLSQLGLNLFLCRSVLTTHLNHLITSLHVNLSWSYYIREQIQMRSYCDASEIDTCHVTCIISLQIYLCCYNISFQQRSPFHVQKSLFHFGTISVCLKWSLLSNFWKPFCFVYIIFWISFFLLSLCSLFSVQPFLL